MPNEKKIMAGKILEGITVRPHFNWTNGGGCQRLALDGYGQ